MVFREKLKFDEQANAQLESERLAERARVNGLSENTIAEMRASFEPLLTDLVATGKLLKAQGSQLVVDRKISGPGYNLSFHFGVNEKSSFFSRLRQFIGIK